jgi:hypothetical protein
MGMLEANEFVCELYAAASRAGYGWAKPRHEEDEGCHRFSAQIVPPEWQRQERPEVELHLHDNGEGSSLTFAVPLYVEPHWDGFAMAAKAQNILAEQDEDGYAGEVSVQYHVDQEGVPQLEGVWVEVSWELEAYVRGERGLDFDWAFESLTGTLKALAELVRHSVHD